jgi:hypothetical protein
MLRERRQTGDEPRLEVGVVRRQEELLRVPSLHLLVVGATQPGGMLAGLGDEPARTDDSRVQRHDCGRQIRVPAGQLEGDVTSMLWPTTNGLSTWSWSHNHAKSSANPATVYSSAVAADPEEDPLAGVGTGARRRREGVRPTGRTARRHPWRDQD